MESAFGIDHGHISKAVTPASLGQAVAYGWGGSGRKKLGASTRVVSGASKVLRAKQVGVRGTLRDINTAGARKSEGAQREFQRAKASYTAAREFDAGGAYPMKRYKPGQVGGTPVQAMRQKGTGRLTSRL